MSNQPTYIELLSRAYLPPKHKVFVSYYHKDDEYYRYRFEQLFGSLFINKSVMRGEIDTDVSTDYIKRLIQEDYISDASVLVVLVGPKTYCRKHIDWEIYAALDKKVNGYAGLAGLCLPSHPDYIRSIYNPAAIPERLGDNLRTGYSKFYNWTEDAATIKNIIEEAFQARTSKSKLIDNSRLQCQKNRCD